MFNDMNVNPLLYNQKQMDRQLAESKPSRSLSLPANPT